MSACHYHRERHPAKKWFIIAFIFLLLTVVLSYITVFIPWSFKDIGVGLRIWAFPFKNCIEYTFSTRNAEYCEDNDYSSEDSVSGGNPKCRGFIIATICFVFITVIAGVFTMIALGITLWRIWTKPILLACLTQFGLFVVFVAALLAWVMWSIYVGITCKENSVLFPLGGFSYGFVIHVFATFTAMLALAAGYVAIFKVLKFKPFCENTVSNCTAPNPEPACIPSTYMYAMPSTGAMPCPSPNAQHFLPSTSPVPSSCPQQYLAPCPQR